MQEPDHSRDDSKVHVWGWGALWGEQKKILAKTNTKNVQTFECVVFGYPKGGMFLNLDGKGDYRDEDGGSVQGSGPGGTLTFYLENSENFEQKVEYKEEKKLSPSIL